jgi:enolase-phosphatase E1
VTVSLSALQTRALLLDIEGTTTPVEFVYHVLFPYARAHAAEYLARHHGSADCREAVALLRKESGVAQDAKGSGVAQDAKGSGVAQDAKGSGVAQDFSPAKILEYAFSLMDRDKKSPGLKALQGLIWQDGYKSGELRGQVYPDVPPAFERWRARGLDIYIYSSGSVLAQQLLFGSTNAGDLTKFLKGYFDTAVGPKTSPDSYRAISERLHIAPPETLFVSDVVQELDAARTSGMRTVLCVRGTDAPSGSEAHPVIRSFNEIVD